MPASGLEQIDRDFLQQLYDLTEGDATKQVSMYEIGAALDLDRDASSQVAQTLIGLNYVEIKTLSGGVGISPDGIDAIEGGSGPSESATGGPPGLSRAEILNQADREALEQVCGFIKAEAGGLGLNYEGLTELVADLRTIDAQLTSNRPKTEVVVCCLKSIAAIMDGLGHREASNRLQGLMGG